MKKPEKIVVVMGLVLCIIACTPANDNREEQNTTIIKDNQTLTLAIIDSMLMDLESLSLFFPDTNQIKLSEHHYEELSAWLKIFEQWNGYDLYLSNIEQFNIVFHIQCNAYYNIETEIIRGRMDEIVDFIARETGTNIYDLPLFYFMTHIDKGDTNIVAHDSTHTAINVSINRLHFSPPQ